MEQGEFKRSNLFSNPDPLLRSFLERSGGGFLLPHWLDHQILLGQTYAKTYRAQSLFDR